jgi:hypothetical protein
VPAGRYRVAVNTSPPTTIERVEVTAGETEEVVLDQGG